MALTTITIDASAAISAANTLRQLSSRSINFAVMRSINQLAWLSREEWIAKSPALFDRPTPLTQKALQFTKATKDTLSSTLKFRDEAQKGTAPDRYLNVHLTGGARPQKRFEARLQASYWMPRGTIAVPGAGAKLDRFGNISQGTIGRILSALGAQFDVLQNETRTSRERRERKSRRSSRPKVRFFAVTVKRRGLEPGIYERTQFRWGSSVKPIIRFVRPGNYRPRLKDYNFAQDVIRRNAERVLSVEISAEIERLLRLSK